MNASVNAAAAASQTPAGAPRRYWTGWVLGAAVFVAGVACEEKEPRCPDGSGGSACGVGTGGTSGSGGSDAASSAGRGGAPSVVATSENLLVAFIGDQGNNEDSSDVLELIASEGAAAVVHNGDFDYADDPSAWDDRINRILGENFPYFATVGNHDAAAWSGPGGYADKIAARHARVADMQCTGEIGVQATCHFHGLHLVQSCIGTRELRATCGKDSSQQVRFIADALASDGSIFSVCNWHKNQRDMQVGAKGNQVGWRVYQECMRGGAIIATGHEHSYARTRALTDLGKASTGHGVTGSYDLLEIGSGRTFVFVSGLAGLSIRNYSAFRHDDDTWWASYYAGNRWLKNGVDMHGVADYGALFIEFHVAGDARRARAYFKDVDGRLADVCNLGALASARRGSEERSAATRLEQGRVSVSSSWAERSFRAISDPVPRPSGRNLTTRAFAPRPLSCRVSRRARWRGRGRVQCDIACERP